MLTLRPYQQEAVGTLITKIKNKKRDNVLVNASVGAGKSLIIAETLKFIEAQGERALCLTLNSTLISQNYQTYIHQQGSASIFCASLNIKNTSGSIIFGAPITVKKALDNEDEISKIKFTALVIDEAHNCNDNDDKTSYMNIINHYKNLNPNLIVIGLTGTPYRGKGFSIVGKDKLFKESVANITTEWLVKNNYLVPPVWGYFDPRLDYDFSSVKTNKHGVFTQKSLAKAVDDATYTTNRIMRQVQQITKDRNGVFIFASSIKHCQDIHKILGSKRSAIITGKTTDRERTYIINSAKMGSIKYLINVNVLTTGIDIPNFDTIVMVRPTESLVLYTQCIGRGLRLYPGKKECLILDYAKNLDRHGDLDSPLIRDAYLEYRKTDYNYSLECPECGVFNQENSFSCDNCKYLFKLKECPYCSKPNDVRARKCNFCHCELIDPNLKLTDFPACKDKVKSFSYGTEYYCTDEYFYIQYSFDSKYLRNKYPNFCEQYSIKSKSGINKFKNDLLQKIIKTDIPNEINKKSLTNLIKKKQLKEIVSIEGVETYAGLKVFIRNFESRYPLTKYDNKHLVVRFYSQCCSDTIFRVFYHTICDNKKYVFSSLYNVTNSADHKKFKKLFKHQDINLIHALAKTQELVQPKYIKVHNHHVEELIPYSDNEEVIQSGFPYNMEDYNSTFEFNIVDIEPHSNRGDVMRIALYGYDASKNSHMFFCVNDWFGYKSMKLYKENRLKKAIIEKHSRYDPEVTKYILDDGTILNNDSDMKQMKERE